jgi:Mg/Co/Ni transporter MgtE
MNRQTDPEPVTPSDPASRPRAGNALPADPRTAGERIRESLGQDRVGVAVSLLRDMLAADQGVFLARAPRTVRGLLVTLLPAHELSDILEEAPTEAAVTIARELPADRAAEFLDDVGSNTVADILRNCPKRKPRQQSRNCTDRRMWYRCFNTRRIPPAG